MNHKLFSLISSFKKPREKDMFSLTNRRLTRNYSGLLILFLTLFIVIVYGILYYSILKSSEQDLEKLVAQEAGYIEKYLVDNELNNFRELQSEEIVFTGVNQVFYYVMNPDGDIIMGNEEDSRLQSVLLPLLNNRITYENEIFQESIHMKGIKEKRGDKKEYHRPEIEQDIRLMIASHNITYKGQVIGKLFIGRDFTFASQLFQWILIILVGLGVVFFGLAILMSQKMSKKAMIPISTAFTRQREFVADASHELRTPLAVLQSSIDAMEMAIEPTKDDFREKLLKNMRQEVKRMTNLVGDLLTLARSDSNTVELRKEKIDFRQIAKEALESLQALANEKAITTSLKAPHEVAIIGDADRLSQLVFILLDNAIKYMPAGGEVKISLSQAGSDLCIAVQDTGIGIKGEDLNRIFERFYRADKSRSRQMGGHGLGLSIAKWIVDTHKGTIEVSSEPGSGSTFLVKLPRNL
ncbi:MAG TPA: ATP-binding protein [Ureibacillus sp.]|nr:ATP-binding protein [Ureibacillus sp.]